MPAAGSQRLRTSSHSIAAGEHNQHGQAVGADQLAALSSGVSSRVDAERVPREAGEHCPAQPFGDRPGAGENEHQGDRALASEPPGEAGRDRRINGEVERQQHDRDPAEPRRHRRLIGKGGRDPVEADDELAEPEPPADGERLSAATSSAQISSHRTANASGINGHSPTGAKAKADNAPSQKANEEQHRTVIARSAATKQSTKAGWIASLRSQ